MADTRSVGTRGLLRIRPDDSALRDAIRHLTEHHRVTEATAKYWARSYAAKLWLMEKDFPGMVALAWEDDFCLGIARQYHVSQDHTLLFVAYVRTWLTLKEKQERLGVRKEVSPVVRTWRSLEQQMAEQASGSSAKL